MCLWKIWKINKLRSLPLKRREKFHWSWVSEWKKYSERSLLLWFFYCCNLWTRCTWIAAVQRLYVWHCKRFLLQKRLNIACKSRKKVNWFIVICHKKRHVKAWLYTCVCAWYWLWSRVDFAIKALITPCSYRRLKKLCCFFLFYVKNSLPYGIIMVFFFFFSSDIAKTCLLIKSTWIHWEAKVNSRICN